jgi:hypothetical protein
MNKLKYLILVITAISVVGCKNEQSSTEETQAALSEGELIEGKAPVKTERENFDKTLTENPKSSLIDIEKEAKIKFGDYFLTYNGTNLSLCCQFELHNPFGGLDNSTIKTYLTDFELKIDTTEYSYDFIYTKNNSSFRIVELRPEKSGEEGSFIGKGKLLDGSVTLPNGIKIGMDKKDLLDKYFVYPEKLIDSLIQIAVCEDERGELFTKYKFDNGQLIEIEFGSHDEK